VKFYFIILCWELGESTATQAHEYRVQRITRSEYNGLRGVSTTDDVEWVQRITWINGLRLSTANYACWVQRITRINELVLR